MDTPIPTRKNAAWRFQFVNTDLRTARQAAEATLKAAGFSVGRRQRGAPSGILLGEFEIMKWRNLSPADREALHGQLHGDCYPVVASFPSSLPDEVDDALLAMSNKMNRDAIAAAAPANDVEPVEQA